MKPIHYLWVGPKPTDGKKGMDTMGVDLMRAKYPDQDIHFWCLNSEVDKYKKHFAARHGEENIQVHGIESFVKENGDLKYLVFIKNLLDRADKFTNTKHKVQEWVTIKDSLDYYLQKCIEGVILDSSVTPDENVSKSKPLFEGLNKFTVPCYMYPEIGVVHDPWFICTDLSNDTVKSKAQKRFDNYFEGVNNIISMLEDKPQVPSFIRDSVTEHFIKWVADETETFTESPFPGMHLFKGIKKVFLNTHKTESTTSRNHPVLSLLEANALTEAEYYMEENNLLPFEPLPCSVFDRQTHSIKTGSMSILNHLKEQKQRNIINIKNTQEALDALSGKLTEEIETLKARKEQGEFDPKPYTEKPAPKDNSLASRKGVNFKITLPPTAAGISFHQTTPRIPPQSKPMSSDEKLAYLIKDAKRRTESDLALKRKLLETYREQIEHYSAAIERFDSLFEEKIKHFDSDLFFETLNHVSSHLFSHLAIESPKPIHSTDELIDYLSGSPQKGPLMALTKCLLANGPITPDNKVKYIASIKTYLKESSTQREEPRLFKDEVKMPFQEDKTNQFLDTLIARLNTQSSPEKNN